MRITEEAAPCYWRKMKKTDVSLVQALLSGVENDYVSACARFLTRQVSKEPAWLLRKNKDDILALVINSRSTVIPVFHGLNEIPDLNFLKGFLRIKKIHSVQGLKNEVILMENEINKTGLKTADIIDYDLMSLDSPSAQLPAMTSSEILINKKYSGHLSLCVPDMADLDALAPLQAAYEQEEVIPNGSVFNTAASRVNLAQIIAKGKIMAAKLDGKFVGKINVSAVSFTRYQVGGVYVAPGFRGLGIAGKMASVFISSLINNGMGVTLFVKKSNTAARRLYASLGFIARGDYRITYY